MREPYQTRLLTLLTLAVAFIAISMLGCQKEEPIVEEAPSPEPVVERQPWAVLYAFDAEGEQLREWIPLSFDTVWAGRRVAFGRYGHPVVLAASGMGMSNAAATAQYVIDRYKPKGIIFTGICGALDPELNIGDIVIPAKWITHDYGTWGKKGFEMSGVPVGRTDSAGFLPMVDLPVDTGLFGMLTRAADRIDFRFRKVAMRLPEVHINGTGVSGNAFVDSKQKRLQLHSDYHAQIVDMESAAVVQTANANGIPVVVIRSCSDLAGGSGLKTASEQLNEFFEVAAHNSALVVREFIENPEEDTAP